MKRHSSEARTAPNPLPMHLIPRRAHPCDTHSRPYPLRFSPSHSPPAVRTFPPRALRPHPPHTPPKLRPSHRPNPAAPAVTLAAEPATLARALPRVLEPQRRASAKAPAILSPCTPSTPPATSAKAQSALERTPASALSRAPAKSPRAQVAASEKSSTMAVAMRRPHPHPTHKTKTEGGCSTVETRVNLRCGPVKSLTSCLDSAFRTVDTQPHATRHPLPPGNLHAAIIWPRPSPRLRNRPGGQCHQVLCQGLRRSGRQLRQVERHPYLPLPRRH